MVKAYTSRLVRWTLKTKKLQGRALGAMIVAELERMGFLCPVGWYIQPAHYVPAIDWKRR